MGDLCDRESMYGRKSKITTRCTGLLAVLATGELWSYVAIAPFVKINIVTLDVNYVLRYYLIDDKFIQR